jgi:hypothetical protein
VDICHPAKDVDGSIARIIVQEWSTAGEFVFHVGKPSAALAGIDIILAADREPDPITGRYDDAGRPNLDVEVELINLS